MISTSVVRPLIDAVRSSYGTFVMAFLMLVSSATAMALDSVTVTPGIPVGYEANSSPATFIVTRSGSTGTLDVHFSLSGTATLPGNAGADYAVSPALTGASSGTISFIQGETSKPITITPVDDALVEGRESVLISLVSDIGYIIGASPSAQVDIADNDLVATIQVRDAVADEDTLVGLATDPDIRRRGVVRVQFSPTAASFARTLTVQFGGRATQGTDYVLQHKIGGSSAASGGLSQIGNDPSAGNLTTGMNYRVYKNLIGDTDIQISKGSAAIANGASITFAGDTQSYVVSAVNNTSNANGPGQITISPGLAKNLAPGTAITVVGATPPTGFTVLGYDAGDTTVKLGDGPDQIFIGDVMTFGSDPSTYVATSDMTGTQGAVNFIRFTGGGTGAGLNLAITSVVETTTLFTTPVTGGLAQIRVPALSTRVDFSIAPVADAAVEGAEDVTVTIVGDRDYAIQNPTVGTVLIADANAIATVALGSNAGKPNTSGSFVVTLSAPFPVPVTVPYSIVPGTTTAVAGRDYVALPGSITIPAGQTTGTIAVNPLNTAALGLTTVTISLDNTLDYKLGGSGSSSTNPSASVNITDSLGVVSIAATSPQALENPTSPVPGAFTVSILRNGAGAISVNYVVTGSAPSGSRYVALSNSVTIPDGQTSVQIPVTPVDNLLADGNQSVVVTLAGGQGYSIDPTATGAQVTIVDDEPVISVSRVADAVEPATAGGFLVSYPGVPAGTALNRPVVVGYSFSGTAVPGTDFTNSSTVTIPANSTSAVIPISPLGNSVTSDKTVTVTLAASPVPAAYTIGSGTASLAISASPAATASQSKPAPGSIDTGSSKGCGHGSGFATLVGLALLAMGLTIASLRRERGQRR